MSPKKEVKESYSAAKLQQALEPQFTVSLWYSWLSRSTHNIYLGELLVFNPCWNARKMLRGIPVWPMWRQTHLGRKRSFLCLLTASFFLHPFQFGTPVHLMVILIVRTGHYLLYLAIVMTTTLPQNHSSINIQHALQHWFERASGWARMEAEAYVWQVHSWGLTRLRWMIAPKGRTILKGEKKLREGTF